MEIFDPERKSCGFKSIRLCVDRVTVSFLKGSNTKRANGMASEGCSKDMNSSFGGKFQWLFDQGKGNSVLVRKGFELSE